MGKWKGREKEEKHRYGVQEKKRTTALPMAVEEDNIAAPFESSSFLPHNRLNKRRPTCLCMGHLGSKLSAHPTRRKRSAGVVEASEGEMAQCLPREDDLSLCGERKVTFFRTFCT
jgi:hypothetical protein